MRWAEITVKCASETTDAVSYAFIKAGCGGVMITGTNPTLIQGSMPVNDELMLRLEGLRHHLYKFEEFGLPPLLDDITLKYAEDEDWAEAWKKYFKPLHLGKRIVIKPSWELYETQPGELVIELDPGMAFGTGGHPTTRLCLEALEERVVPGSLVADIGTGSGILSLAAAKLGAGRVIATDIDSLPRKIAGENIVRNELEDTITLLDIEHFDPAAQNCQLVVANIVANTIVELAESISKRIVGGGIFIASGVVEEHHDLVRDTLEAVGLRHLETKRDDIWVCLVSMKSAESAIDASTLLRASAELPPIGGVGIIPL